MIGPHLKATSSSRASSRRVGVAVALCVLAVALCVLAGAVVARGIHPRAPGAPATACCPPGPASRPERVRPALPDSLPAIADGDALDDVSGDSASDRAGLDAEAPTSGHAAGRNGDIRPPPPPEAFLPAPARASPDRDTGLVFDSEAMGGSLLEAQMLEAKVRATPDASTRSADSLPPSGSADIRPPPPPEVWLPPPPRAVTHRDTGLIFSNQPPSVPASDTKR